MRSRDARVGRGDLGALVGRRQQRIGRVLLEDRVAVVIVLAAALGLGGEDARGVEQVGGGQQRGLREQARLAQRELEGAAGGGELVGQRGGGGPGERRIDEHAAPGRDR